MGTAGRCGGAGRRCHGDGRGRARRCHGDGGGCWGTAQHRSAPLSTAQHRTAQHCPAQNCTALHSTAQHRTAPYGSARLSTAQDRPAPHSTAPLSTAQHRSALPPPPPHSTAPPCNTQLSTAPLRTTQHSTAPPRLLLPSPPGDPQLQPQPPPAPRARNIPGGGDGDGRAQLRARPPLSPVEQLRGAPGRRRVPLRARLHPQRRPRLRARTFPGRLTPRDPKAVAASPVLEADLPRLFQRILGSLDAYVASSLLEPPRGAAGVTVLHSFSVLSSVTAWHVEEAVASFQARCQPRDPGCRLLRDVVTYSSLSLCELQPCDPVSTVCLPQEGLALCACRPGFRSAHPMDRACTACHPGSRLRDDACERCPFGFGGFECEEPLLLALVLVSCCGGALLLLLLLLLMMMMLGGRARRPPPSPPSPLPDLGALQFPARGLSLPRVQPCGTPEAEPPEPPPPARMETFLAHRGGPAGRGEDRDYF
ncbi:mucin-13-like [Anser cygnoides]|uniref:mucin-13-like n=1 Tax=Anser cygnoides TaxID=8845 RepID=UPI0034D21B5F